jgi:hypothetical protein
LKVTIFLHCISLYHIYLSKKFSYIWLNGHSVNQPEITWCSEYRSFSVMIKEINTVIRHVTTWFNLLENIFFPFWHWSHSLNFRIPMGTNCDPLIADLFLYCYESQVMAKLQYEPSKHSLNSLFNNNYRYLGEILIINNL